jgi:hypothetical protein
MTTTDLQKLCRDYDPEATEYENILSEAQWRRRNYDRQRGAITHMGPDEKMHVEYWTWVVTNELKAARVIELEAENKRLREDILDIANEAGRWNISASLQMVIDAALKGETK